MVSDFTRSTTSKHLLPRPRQRKPPLHRVEARQSRWLRPAREPGVLPHLAIGQHRQRRVHDRIAGADAPRIGLGAHLESVAVIEIAIGRAARAGVDGHDVAAEHTLAVIREDLAGDVLRRGLEAGRAVLRLGDECRGEQKGANGRKVSRHAWSPAWDRHVRT